MAADAASYADLDDEGDDFGGNDSDWGDDWGYDVPEWKLDEDGTLTVSGKGDLYCGNWEEYEARKSEVKKLVVSVTDVENVYGFYEFENLESADLRGLDVSRVEDLSALFAYCQKLKSVDFGNINTASVTDMSDMFYGCGSLMNLNLSGFNTSSVTDMNGMFEGCSSLTTLNLSSFNTSSVTDMSWMFGGCGSLTSLNLNSFSTAKVTSMVSMFDGCGKLKNLDLSNFNTEQVTDMLHMFDGCHCLKELNLSNFSLNSIEIVDGVARFTFGIIDSLEKITVPANFPAGVEFPYSDTVPSDMHEYWKDASGTVCEGIRPGLSVPMTYTRGRPMRPQSPLPYRTALYMRALPTK